MFVENVMVFEYISSYIETIVFYQANMIVVLNNQRLDWCERPASSLTLLNTEFSFHRISLINWSAISYMGFDSSKVYKENLPFLLNPEYVSRFYMQTMWVWSLADHVNKTYSRRPVPS